MSTVPTGKHATSEPTEGALTGKANGRPPTSRRRERTVRVRMETELGSIIFDIYPQKAPITAANFLRYVDEGRYAGANFYRTVHQDNQPDDKVKITVIQGGLGDVKGDRLPPIGHETTQKTGLLHVDGTLSMARLAVGTAESEFFICIGDQPQLDFGGARNPDGEGFAAFGRMVSGREVAKSISRQPEARQRLGQPIAIITIQRVE